MNQLSGLDASFLYLESSAQLMHVCGLILVDPSTMPGGYDYQSFRDELERRVGDVPLFRRKLHHVPGGIDHPVWVRDEDFDIDRHVHRLAVPSPGEDHELAEVCSHLAGIPLDRSRPLWEMWVIEGLHSGQVAIFSKMHHASVDGVSGSNMISFLCSLEPDAPPLELDEGSAAELMAERSPSDLGLLARGMVHIAGKPLRAAQMVRPTISLLTKSLTRARSGTAMAAPLTAPRTSFNGTISGRRAIAFVDMSLERIKEIKSTIDGATVNDVVLAVSGGALRRYLHERGELPEHSLLATVPVSVHDRSHKEGANKVSSLFTRLGTDVADPAERVRVLATHNVNAKEHHEAIPADTLQDWAQFAAPRVFGLAVRVVSSLRLADAGPVIHNLVISNVPGPPVPLYFMGARIDALYPLGPIFHGAGLNITVMSSNGRMHVGLIGCREQMPHLWDLAGTFAAELEALYAATVGGSPEKDAGSDETSGGSRSAAGGKAVSDTTRSDAGKKVGRTKKASATAKKPSATREASAKKARPGRSATGAEGS